MSQLNGKSFLIVDDDEMLREVLSEVFRGQGAEVVEAINGHVAFNLLQKNKFDVVVSDVRMPGGDGITLAKNINSMQGLRPLVFICSGFNDLDPIQAKNFNILKVFEKPFDYRLIISEIAKHLT